MGNTKANMFDEIVHITENDDKEQLFTYMFNYFSSIEIAQFIEHIKEEKGSGTTLDYDE